MASSALQDEDQSQHAALLHASLIEAALLHAALIEAFTEFRSQAPKIPPLRRNPIFTADNQNHLLLLRGETFSV